MTFTHMNSGLIWALQVQTEIMLDAFPNLSNIYLKLIHTMLGFNRNLRLGTLYPNLTSSLVQIDS